MIFKAKDMRFGGKDVQRLLLGDKVLWERGAYLDIFPESVWLLTGNDYRADVEVFSNVQWNTD